MKKLLPKLKRRWDSAVRKYSPAYKINHKNRGVINFIDIGSVGGLPEPWDRNANKIRFCLNFEPNEPSKRTPNSMTCDAAIWEKDESKDFYIYRGFKGTGSSLFKQNFDYVRENYETLKTRGRPDLAESWFERSELVRQTTLECRAIDNVLADELPSTPFHFMKIDAQGAEYNILKGAEKLLTTSCVGLHLELFTVPLYQGIRLLDDVENYLKDFGFQKVKQFPPHGTFHSQNDCLFLKSDLPGAGIMSTIKKVYEL